MARQLRHFHEAPRPCSYLPEQVAQLEHRILVDATPAELEHLLDRGWRRFGPDHFRPACPACSACEPTRVPIDTFRPSKSQRRAARKCESLVRTLGPPSVDDERLALYAAWHAERERARGWEGGPIDEVSYRIQFAFPHPSAREIAWREPSGELVAVSLCDETPSVWSAVYFFYAPRWGTRSIGVANVVHQVELARARGIAHLHLGYRVAGCPSLAYKAAFGPQERLVGWPTLREPATWRSAAPNAAGDGARTSAGPEDAGPGDAGPEDVGPRTPSPSAGPPRSTPAE